MLLKSRIFTHSMSLAASERHGHSVVSSLDVPHSKDVVELQVNVGGVRNGVELDGGQVDHEMVGDCVVMGGEEKVFHTV